MNEQTTQEFTDNEGTVKATDINVKHSNPNRIKTLEETVEQEQLDQARQKEKIALDLKQENVEFSGDGNVVTIGNNDVFDQMFAEFYGCKRPGFDALYSDERFPMKNGRPMVVSRCYQYPIDGKYLLFDILEENEYTPGEMKENKAIFEALGFLYTWVYKGEKNVSLKDIFETRLTQKVPKVKAPKLFQNNVDFAKTT